MLYVYRDWRIPYWRYMVLLVIREYFTDRTLDPALLRVPWGEIFCQIAWSVLLRLVKLSSPLLTTLDLLPPNCLSQGVVLVGCVKYDHQPSDTWWLRVRSALPVLRSTSPYLLWQEHRDPACHPGQERLERSEGLEIITLEQFPSQQGMLLVKFFIFMSIRFPLSTSNIATTDDLSGKATSWRTSENPGYLLLFPVFELK